MRTQWRNRRNESIITTYQIFNICDGRYIDAMYSLRKQDTMKGQSVQWPIIIAYEIFNIRDGCYVDTMYSSRIVFCGVASKRVVLGFHQLSTFSRIPLDSVIIESTIWDGNDSASNLDAKNWIFFSVKNRSCETLLYFIVAHAI